MSMSVDILSLLSRSNYTNIELGVNYIFLPIVQERALIVREQYITRSACWITFFSRKG